jgi:hypothetical protein
MSNARVKSVFVVVRGPCGPYYWSQLLDLRTGGLGKSQEIELYREKKFP